MLTHPEDYYKLSGRDLSHLVMLAKEVEKHADSLADIVSRNPSPIKLGYEIAELVRELNDRASELLHFKKNMEDNLI